MNLPSLTIEDIVEHVEAANGENPQLLEKLHAVLQVFLNHQTCSQALSEIKEILKSDTTVDREEVCAWVSSYEQLGRETLGMFFIDYFSLDAENAGDLQILPEGVRISREKFISIIQFCKIFQILYWNLELHRPKEKRATISPLDYYHRCVQTGRFWDRVGLDTMMQAKFLP